MWVVEGAVHQIADTHEGVLWTTPVQVRVVDRCGESQSQVDSCLPKSQMSHYLLKPLRRRIHAQYIMRLIIATQFFGPQTHSCNLGNTLQCPTSDIELLNRNSIKAYSNLPCSILAHTIVYTTQVVHCTQY
jgi:hypothetical protein